MNGKEAIQQLWTISYPELKLKELAPMQGGGSDRQYFRVFDESNHSIVGVYNEDLEENEDFFSLSEKFGAHGVHVASVLTISDNRKTYLLEDLGDTNLLDIATDETRNKTEIKAYYEKAIDQLLGAQQALDKTIDPTDNFGEEMVLHDLMYFLYDFVKVTGIEFEPREVLYGIMQWVDTISDFRVQGFMYRDFQGRNIMVSGDKTYLIDFQGGMYGPMAYDMASLLYQARAQLSPEMRTELWEHYKSEFEKRMPEKYDEAGLESDYQYCIFIRLLQVLGAYGFRGIVQGKKHFLDSIPMGLENLRNFLEWTSIEIPEGFKKVLTQITDKNFIQKYQPHA